MTDKIILELTLDELKLIDKYVELNDETQSVFDKIKYAYPQPKMTLQQEGDYAVVSYNDTTYYRLMGEDATCFSWYKRIVVIPSFPTPTLVMVDDAETERLLEGLYYNHIEVKKETEMIRQNLKTSLEELANGDMRPIDDVIKEAKEEQTKTPCEIAYKDWWGIYPELENDTEYDDTRWHGFQAGYHFAYEEKVKETAQERGERLHKDVERVVKENLEWFEEHSEEDPLDWLKPQTPEQTEQSLKEAFREAQQTEKWKELQRKIDAPAEGIYDNIDIDKLLKKWEENPPEFLKFELGKTLEDICMRWWDDIFTINSSWDSITSIQDFCDRVELWLPREQDASGSQDIYAVAAVEGFNDCLKKIKSKLRNKKDT